MTNPDPIVRLHNRFSETSQVPSMHGEYQACIPGNWGRDKITHEYRRVAAEAKGKRRRAAVGDRRWSGERERKRDVDEWIDRWRTRAELCEELDLVVNVGGAVSVGPCL